MCGFSRAKRGKFFQFTALLIEKFMKSRAKMHGIKLSLKVRFQFTKHFQYRNIQFSRRFQFTSPTDVRVSIYQQISIYRLSGISTCQHNFNFNLLCVQNFNFNLPAQYQFTDCADFQFTGRCACPYGKLKFQ